MQAQLPMDKPKLNKANVVNTNQSALLMAQVILT